jgi:hypothetical protein
MFVYCWCQVSSGTSANVQSQPAVSMTATSGFGIPFTGSTTAGTEVMTTSSPVIQELASSSVTAAVEHLFTGSTTAGAQVTQIVSSGTVANVDVETETTTASG